MTVYEDIKARIVGDFLEVAERWQLKAQEWGPEQQFVAYQDMVCQQILDLLSEGLWPEEAS